MIIDVNKIYIFSAPQAAESMTPGPDDFITGSSTDMAFVKIKKISHTDGDTRVKWMGKVFEYKGQWIQAVIFYTDLPYVEAKKRINAKIAAYNAAAKEKK